MAAGLLVVAALVLLAMHALTLAVHAGVPGWLNGAVLVLAWDAIKIAWLAV